MAGKVTIGLALQWPHITDISGSPPTGSRPGRGRWAPPYALLWSMVDFTFTITLLMMSETRFLGLLYLQNVFFSVMSFLLFKILVSKNKLLEFL